MKHALQGKPERVHPNSQTRTFAANFVAPSLPTYNPKPQDFNKVADYQHQLNSRLS